MNRNNTLLLNTFDGNQSNFFNFGQSLCSAKIRHVYINPYEEWFCDEKPLNNEQQILNEQMLNQQKIKLSKDADDCVICIEKMKKNENVIILNCCHKFHSNCLKKWLIEKKECPVCRLNIS